MTVHQDGRDVVARPGDVYILDPRRPFTIGIASKTDAIVFKIPRAELQARLGEIGSYTATPLARAEPITALASEFIRMFETPPTRWMLPSAPKLRGRRSTSSH